ncbi:MAG: DUF4872 domain-containing protein [Anaerolineae bacterium]|nr:DUF4872 domain-containing protein [Anaerolineae bacterium]
MTYRLENYTQFGGNMGTVRNALAYQGVTMPHTGEAPTQALLFGISGGVVAGYFAFEYAPALPYLHFLTRNTFDPMNKMMDRLGIITNARQTDNPDKAVENLVNTLVDGKPAIVMVAYPLMPYNLTAPTGDNEFTYPVIVYAYDPATGTVLLSDRAQVPLGIMADELAAARANPKKNKHRLMTVDLPNADKLVEAVTAGINETIESFVGEPPRKPMAGKYGLSAYDKWIEMLNANSKEGWAKKFAPGERMLSGLISSYYYANVWITAAPNASRSEYADFLDEAALILSRPALKDAADQWREAARQWQGLNDALLPARMPPFDRVRQLIDMDNQFFLEKGRDADEQRVALKAELDALKQDIVDDFPLGDAGVAVMIEAISDSIQRVKDVEAEAITLMQAAMSE